MHNTDFKIRFAKEVDCDSVTRIADSQLGKSYVTKSAFNKMFNVGNFCMVAENENTKQVVGFCFCKRIDYLKLKNICKGNEIQELQFAKQIGYIKTIAVDEDFKNQGIATKLLQNCLIKLQNDGAEAFASTAWVNKDRINIATPLTRNGFVKNIELADYWYESSVKEKFNCPQCGNPCHCTCVLYIKF